MNWKKNRAISFIILAMMLLNLLIIILSDEASAAAVIDNNDGFWFDSFQDNTNVTLYNCSILDKIIVLSCNPTVSTYDFKSIDHKAFTLDTVFFIPFLSPGFYIRYGRELSSIGYSRIKYLDGNMITTESTYLKRVAMHLFRFQIKQKEKNISQMEITWHGKAYNDRDVRLYYWQPVGEKRGGWNLISNKSSNGSMIKLKQSFTGDLFISSDGYVYICVVAPCGMMEKCTLLTDYVNINVTSEGYASSGVVISSVISPSKLSAWERLTSQDYTPPGTSIRYQLLYGNSSLIPESILPGNKEGFKTPLTLTSKLPASVKTIRLKATLETNNPVYSPRIYSWGVLWQTEKNKWRDLYNSTLRVDSRDRVDIIKGNATMRPIYDEWCVFGQNPANTRASEGAGARNNTMYWYSSSSVKVGGGFKNPVVKSNRLYIPSSDGKKIHVFNVTVPTSRIGEANTPVGTITIPENAVTNTPVVTDDLIIIATGNTSDSGVANKIYAYTHNYTQSWFFQYPDEPRICYSASPVVSDQTLYITSWSGDTSLLGSYKDVNNRVMAISVKTGVLLWSSTLPAGSFSTPAVSDRMVIVGCDNERNYSLFAYDRLTGGLMWKSKVGSVRYSSPVIYNDRVYVVTKETVVPLISARTKLVAVDINDGHVIYNVTLGSVLSYNLEHAASTPCVFNDVLYAASPDGVLYAINTDNGEVRWSKRVYSKSALSSQVLISSPGYADSMVYIGTPDGLLVVLNADDGSYVWNSSYTEGYSPVLSSPVITNGLVYFSDENGVLYSVGYYKESRERIITGSLTSIPIHLPVGYTWGRFKVEGYNASAGASITYSILDESYRVIASSISDNENISSMISGYRSIRLRGVFTISNISQRVNLNGWSISFQPVNDTEPPVFINRSFTPVNGYTNTKTPTCSINVYDTGTGLNVKTARFTLEYKTRNQTTVKTYTGNASCSGANGSTSTQTITINISKLPFSGNISDVIRIRFYISDMNGNGNYSGWYQLRYDTVKPSSSITNKNLIPNKCNMSNVEIKANASDTGGSGLASVDLYYKLKGENTYRLYASDKKPPYVFLFTTNISGEYDLCTIAVDNASNREDFPSEPDLRFTYDKNKPSISVTEGMIWLNSSDSIIPVVFRDDYRLAKVEYRVGDSSWLTLASDINESLYDEGFTLPASIWGSLEEGRVYHLSIRVSDVCGNTFVLTSTHDTIKIGKDTSPPVITVDTSDVTSQWQWGHRFRISALVTDADGSGLNNVSLYYQYSSDNNTWSEWRRYGEVYTSPSMVWDFSASEGNGYYRFKIQATDLAGNIRTEYRIISVSAFPSMLFTVLVVLLLFSLLLLVVFLFKRRRTMD